MSPYLQAIALTATDRIMLKVQGVLSCPAPKTGGKTVGTKNTVKKGYLTKIAHDYIAGRYGSKSFVEVADQEGINDDSLRAAVWRHRHAKKAAA